MNPIKEMLLSVMGVVGMTQAEIVAAARKTFTDFNYTPMKIQKELTDLLKDKKITKTDRYSEEKKRLVGVYALSTTWTKSEFEAAVEANAGRGPADELDDGLAKTDQPPEMIPAGTLATPNVPPVIALFKEPPVGPAIEHVTPASTDAGIAYDVLLKAFGDGPLTISNADFTYTLSDKAEFYKVLSALTEISLLRKSGRLVVGECK